MNIKLLIFCMVVSCAAAFGFLPYSNSQASTASNVCIYSADADKYSPKCFTCLSAVYPQALQACVNGTTMPSNITYSSARCIEKNCQINYPTPAPLKAKSLPIFELAKSFRDFMNSGAKSKRSIHDHSEQSLMPKHPLKMEDIQVVQEVKTFASDMEVPFAPMELDYEIHT